MSKIKNNIYKSELVDWQSIKDLQPENLKVAYNIGWLRNSILKHGISKAFDVCEIDGDIFYLDGHTRANMFQTLESEGIELPKQIMCNFCTVKNKKDAIQILLEVHNQKLNKIDTDVLTEWIEIEDVEVDLQGVNLSIENVYNSDDIDLDSFFEENNEPKEQKNKIVLEYSDQDFELVNEALKLHSGSKEKIFFKLLGL